MANALQNCFHFLTELPFLGGLFKLFLASSSIYQPSSDQHPIHRETAPIQRP